MCASEIFGGLIPILVVVTAVFIHCLIAIMVRRRHQRASSSSSLPKAIACLAVTVGICMICGFVVTIRSVPNNAVVPPTETTKTMTKQTLKHQPIEKTNYMCPYMKLTDLSANERYAIASKDRHMVTPPHDDGVTLVCCETSQGPWNILVHHSWGRNGARRFLDLVEIHYFHARVPLMRCVDKFLCQFGLNGSNLMKQFRKTIPDDENWLPKGKEFRINADNVKRFQKGYFAYAGSGPNSRNLQFIVALNDNGPLGGGSPWEVPWGELVGEHSYRTLDKIYTGYGEKGPKQGTLWKANAIEYVESHFPKMDFIESCTIVDADGEQGVSMSTAAY